MHRITNYVAIWISFLVVLSYVFLYTFVDFYYSKFIADFIALIGLSFMAASTTPVALRAVRNGIRTDTERFLVSYWSIWAVTLTHRLWIIYLGMLNTPLNQEMYQWWREGPVSGLIAILIGISAGHGAIAPFSGSTKLQRRDLIIFSAAAGFSGIIAGMAIGVFVIAGWSN